MSADILALHSSPESLSAAIERLAFPGAGEPALNVGSCGCSVRSVQGPGGIPMSPGAAAAARTLAAKFGGVERILAGLRAMGLAPTNLDTANLSNALNAERGGALPYEDALADCRDMDTLVSLETVVPALETSVDVTISAAQGWFFAYYIDVSVIRISEALATCVEPCAYTMSQPLVDGCPPPPCQGSGNPQRNAAFYVRRDTASGCGRPFQAVVPSAAQGAPLRVTFDRLLAADIVQVQLRGFCFDTRICC